jgi:hypothetical protein
MRIRHIHFVGVRKHDGLKADWPRKQDTDLIVAHGGRVSGKTTFLDALAAAKERVSETGAYDGRWDAIPDGDGISAKVGIDWELSDDERNRMAISDPLVSAESIIGPRGSSDFPIALRAILGDPGSATRGSIHYLHDGRALEGALPYGADDTAFRQRLTTRNTKFGNLYDVLDQSALASARSLANERFKELCPNLSIDGLRRFGTSFGAMIKDDATGESRSADKLSASERQAYLLALYTARNPIVDSVVLFDAPEIGFGDVGACDVVRALLRWTSRTQIIVATASAAVRDMPETAHVVELGR